MTERIFSLNGEVITAVVLEASQGHGVGGHVVGLGGEAGKLVARRTVVHATDGRLAGRERDGRVAAHGDVNHLDVADDRAQAVDRGRVDDGDVVVAFAIVGVDVGGGDGVAVGNQEDPHVVRLTEQD